MKSALIVSSLLTLGVADSFAQVGDSAKTLDEKTAEQELQAVDSGKLALGDLDLSHCQALVQYYEHTTNQLTPKMKLVLSKCLASSGRYAEATNLVAPYVKLYPRDPSGWKIMGMACYELKAYDTALVALTNLVALGDYANYAGLTATAIALDREDLYPVIAQNLRRLKDSQKYSDKGDFRSDCIVMLIDLALIENSSNWMAQAVENASVEEVMSRHDFTRVMLEACEQFTNMPAIQSLCQKVQYLSSFTNSDPAGAFVAFQAGKLDAEDLVALPGICEKLQSLYASKSNSVPVKMQLALSACLGKSERWTESAKFAASYVTAFSNDWHGWKQLGVAKMNLDSYDEGLAAFTNAVRLGGRDEYSRLGYAALKANRMDIFRDQAAPFLLKLKDSKDPATRIKIVDLLILYSLADGRQDVFVKALHGVKSAEILEEGPGGVKVVLKGWDAWHPAEVRSLCEELERALKAAPEQQKPTKSGS
jgi:tetratricopeptide (TPR) repeat protein